MSKGLPFCMCFITMTESLSFTPDHKSIYTFWHWLSEPLSPLCFSFLGSNFRSIAARFHWLRIIESCNIRELVFLEHVLSVSLF